LIALPLLALRRAPDAAAATFLVLASALCAGEAAWSEGEPDGARYLPASAGALALLALFWTSLAEHAARGAVVPASLAAAGALVMAAGVALRLSAVRALGRFFVSPPRVLPGQPLVTGGPFRSMRHPSETGLLVLSFGACVLLGSLAGLVLWTLAVAPLAAVRVSKEEALLARAFGSEWREYVDETPALLPR
jgi:protein-S-isoprenylcysteine O-methyltransferase Ste14